MNASAFTHTRRASVAVIFMGFLFACTVPAQADVPESAGLVLTLSEDQWLDNDSTHTPNAAIKHSAPSASPMIDAGQSDRPVDVDCGVDSNPIATEANSWGSRLVGKCNFNYQY